ncbi:MAG TPA: DUF3137 domain-containing protein [Nocardioides sp.]|uniref:DUF3137 domain-containing protein n=1 Tax=uncultured Nocardioides sp. TaxID=198441 RepID=UPI000EBC2DCB|nr:DUF3137 domain-containing protein [uncultured Nocardioides sp.]HCB06447.1 hypothetical protein [Nocardioides sp.]HRD60435.1 DUF3137 domain-containing protein [Nocardioides sp.]HRI95460.1 DUF3137 domain-containing protein [Nocardioides sp.]HRK45337.1 DUF3137 domain-containing protein [Nocardioides sp.]
MFAVVALVFSYLSAKQRREELQVFALSRGWRYELEQPRLVDRFTGAPFGIGFGRRAYNVLYGSHDGRDLVAFDYEYKTQTSNGKQTTTQVHRLSVLGLSMGVPMPTLRVDPENFLDRFVGRISGTDIDLESEEFNRAFTVSCPDRKFASDVLHPQMMEYLLQHRQLGWRFERDSMLMISTGGRTPAQIDATLAVMDGISDRVPEFVWLRLKGLG